MESANVKFDEPVQVQNDECTKKIEEYKSFVYFHEGMPNEGDNTNQNGNQKQTSVSTESQIVNVELHLDAELQNAGNAHSDFENSMKEMKNYLMKICMRIQMLKKPTWK